MPSRLRYFFYSALLASFLLPISAYAWDPSNVTATPGACGSGAITIYWDDDTYDGAPINWPTTWYQATFSGDTQLPTYTSKSPNPLPPGIYNVYVDVYGTDYHYIWGYNAPPQKTVTIGGQPNNPNPSITTVSWTGSINPGYNGDALYLIGLYPDSHNSDLFSYSLQDNGNTIPITGTKKPDIPDSCYTTDNLTEHCSYTVTGLSPGSPHSFSVATVIAHESTSAYIAMNNPTSVNAPSACVLPDLTIPAGGDAATSPSSPTAGTPVPLSAIVQNTGTATASGTFNNIIQIDNDTQHLTSYATSTMSTVTNLGAGNTRSISGTYTFPSAGTYYLRACADENATMTGSITEGNDTNDAELNNCGNWVAVTVLSSAPTATLSADPSPVDKGQSSTLTWGSTGGATSCTGTGFTAGGPSGHVSTGPLYTVGTNNYEVICSKGGVNSVPADASVQIVDPQVNITATPLRVLPNASTTISWTSTNTNDCSITRNNQSPAWMIRGPTNGSSVDDHVATQTVYTLTCTTAGTPATASVTVNIGPNYKEF